MRGALLGILLVVAGGCDDEKRVNHLPDAPPPPDGAPDAPETPQPVTLTITQAGIPRPGVKVFFQNADSSIVAETMTSPTGVAAAFMNAGGYVTAIDPFDQVLPQGGRTHELSTFAGVKPGDQLKLKRNAPPLADVNVSIIAPDHPTATEYVLHTSCGSQLIGGGGGGSASAARAAVPVTLSQCGSSTDLAIVASAGGLPAGSVQRFNTALAEGATIDLGAETYTDAVDMTYTFTNVPAGASGLGGSTTLFSPKGALVQWAFAADIVAGNASATTKRPVVAGTVAATATSLFVGSFGRHTVLDWGTPASYALSANLLLPDYTAYPTLDAATKTLSWTVNAGASQPDLAIAQARFGRGKGTLNWNWEIVAPYANASIKLPVLPANAAEYNPMDGELFDTNRLTTAKVPGGYDAVRANALSIQDPARELVVGGMGRAILEELQPPQAARRR